MLFNLGRQRISRIIIGVSVSFVIGLASSSFILFKALNELKINGPVYTKIRNTVDLTADILPPPVYLLEEYMTALQMSFETTAEEKKALLDRLTQLEKDFDTRQEYWKGIDLSAESRKVMNDEVAVPAQKMREAIHSNLLPAFEADNKEGVMAALPDVTAAYKEHRAGIDHLVALALKDLGEAEATAKQESNFYQLLAYSVLSLAVIVTLLGCIGLIYVVAKPIGVVTDGLGRLANGNTNVTIGDSVGDGEMPRLWRAVVGLREKVLGEQKLIADQEETKRRNETEKKKMMHDLADRFQSEIGSIVNAVTSAATELQATAEGMAETARDTTAQSQIVTNSAEQATHNVQTVSAATEELTASIGEIQQRMSQSGQLISEAVEQTRLTNEKVQGLTTAANKIGEVVSLINDIAAQTNLLALNATIEAARAGDAGKGFAVVASEVKALATQTAKATEDIAKQISTIQAATDESARSIQAITQTIDAVSETSSAISHSVEQQGEATQEICRNVTAAAQGTRDVSNNIQNVQDAAQMTGAAASQVLSSAVGLSKDGETLKVAVEAFLNKVRSA